MRTLRTALTVAALCLISGGYAASQWAFFTGRSADYARRVDSAPLMILSGVLLLGAFVLALIRDDSVGEGPK